MKRLLLICGFTAICVMAVIGIRMDASAPVERSDAPLKHEAYVWQRHWDDDLAQAVKLCTGQMEGLCLLGAEVSFTPEAPRVVRVPIDYETVTAVESPVGLALRIGPYSGPYDRHTERLVNLAEELVEQARDNELEPAELQIDFDCAESKLSGYAQWLRAIGKRIDPVSLIFTALPSWLNSRAFSDLVRCADGYVLQVHSLELPTGPPEQMTLCDVTKTRHWVEQAGRHGVDFRVALPTYGYVVGFDAAGKFIGLSAEGPSRSWPADAHMQVVRSDPFVMALLAEQFQQDRPKHMTGLIWYRLPTAKDRLNWTWPTLSAVIAGDRLDRRLCVEVEYPTPGLADIILVNRGNVDMSPDVRVEIGCRADTILASDSLRRFVITEDDALGLCLAYRGPGQFNVMAPGDRWKIAWFRFKEEMEIQPNVIMPAKQE